MFLDQSPHADSGKSNSGTYSIKLSALQGLVKLFYKAHNLFTVGYLIMKLNLEFASNSDKNTSNQTIPFCYNKMISVLTFNNAYNSN